MLKSDNKLSQLLKNDELPFEVDTSILERLNYHLQLKTASSKVKQNSIFPFFGSLLTTKLLGFKVSVLAIAMFTYIGYNEMNKPNLSFPISDSVNVSKSIDSINSLSIDDSLIVH
jgi:hypothetical protein